MRDIKISTENDGVHIEVAVDYRDGIKLSIVEREGKTYGDKRTYTEQILTAELSLEEVSELIAVLTEERDKRVSKVGHANVTQAMSYEMLDYVRKIEQDDLDIQTIEFNLRSVFAHVPDSYWPTRNAIRLAYNERLDKEDGRD